MAKSKSDQRLDRLENSLNQIADLLLAQKGVAPVPQPVAVQSTAAPVATPESSVVIKVTAPPVAETPQEKAVRKAGPDTYAPISPEWTDAVQEIIGEALDHCEMTYLKGGGTKFTIVIKNEFSNAPKDYLDMRKVDRRSKEIGSEGFAGVEAWAKLVASNLKRGK